MISHYPTLSDLFLYISRVTDLYSLCGNKTSILKLFSESTSGKLMGFRPLNQSPLLAKYFLEDNARIYKIMGRLSRRTVGLKHNSLAAPNSS